MVPARGHQFFQLKWGSRVPEHTGCGKNQEVRERARGKGVLAEDVAVQGSRDGRVKQVSNSVQAAASGKDPDSHQSITVWWFLTKEVQGKNSSGGDLNPASCGGSHRLVNAHKKRGTGLLVATWTSRLTSLHLLLWDRAFYSAADGRRPSSPKPQKWKGLSPYKPSGVTLISGSHHPAHSKSLPNWISGPLSRMGHLRSSLVPTPC